MGKRAWFAAAVGLLLGLAAGSACTYLWLKPQVAATSNQGAEVVTPPEPSEQEVRTSFESMLANAGVDAEVVRFRRVKWRRDFTYGEPDGQGGVRKLMNPLPQYSAQYEAELDFLRECRIQENFQMIWSPERRLFFEHPALSGKAENRLFKTGERQQVRGIIDYTLQNAQWKLHWNCRIDAGR